MAGSEGRPLEVFLSEGLDAEHKPHVLDAFGRVWLRQGRPAPIDEADSFRSNILVPADKENDILRLSGFRVFYYSPETHGSQPDNRFAIVWTKS